MNKWLWGSFVFLLKKPRNFDNLILFIHDNLSKNDLIANLFCVKTANMNNLALDAFWGQWEIVIPIVIGKFPG